MIAYCGNCEHVITILHDNSIPRTRVPNVVIFYSPVKWKPNCFIMNAHRLSNNGSQEMGIMYGSISIYAEGEKWIHRLNARLIEIKLKQKFRFISKTCITVV